MINGYQEGSDITLMNTLYSYPKKDSKTNKYDKGHLSIIYRDNITGQKKVQEIEDPEIDYYMVNEEEYIDTNLLFIEKEKVHKETTSYNKLEKDIAEKTGNMQFYKDNIQNGNRYANKKLHMHPRVFSSDLDIQDEYRFRFSKMYTNNTVPITKAMFDIEADTINMKGDFPEPGECPINAITIVMSQINKVYTLLLRNPDNPLIQEFEDSISNNLFVELKDFVRDAVGGPHLEYKYGLNDFQYEFMFYDEDNEIQLIQDLFILINALQPDFVLAWNMSFDIPYIRQRIINLGYNPEDIMCHPDFKHKVAKYYVDERNKNDFAERGDFASISSYSVFLDQMIQFASRRKGQAMFDSFRLDYIGGKIAKVNKLDYSHITTNIAKLPYLNYKVFVFYNIMDTIVQHCVEKKVEDIDYIFNKCLMNNTRYQKGHRQTVYLVNRARKEFDNEGFVLGNNFNRNNEKPSEKFPGALVANPKRVSDYAKMSINGFTVDLLNNLCDYDYKSLYPNIIQEMNMAHNTQIGRILIDDQIYDDENRFDDPHYSRSTEFVENFHSHTFIEFAHRWLNLADYGELYEDIEKYYTEVEHPSRMKWYNPVTGLGVALQKVPDKLMNPLIPYEGPKKFIHYKRPDLERVNNYFGG